MGFGSKIPFGTGIISDLFHCAGHCDTDCCVVLFSAFIGVLEQQEYFVMEKDVGMWVNGSFSLWLNGG